MGLGGISIWQLLIILVIVMLIFGTKRLKNIGGDLGGAIKGFKQAVTSDDDKTEKADQADEPVASNTADAAKTTAQGDADKTS